MTLVLHQWPLFGGSAPVAFAKTTLATTGVTTAVWVLVTLLTPPEPDEVLLRFYRKVRRMRRVAPHRCAGSRGCRKQRDLGRICLPGRLACLVYAALFGVGKLCFGQIGTGSCCWIGNCLRIVAPIAI